MQRSPSRTFSPRCAIKPSPERCSSAAPAMRSRVCLQHEAIALLLPHSCFEQLKIVLPCTELAHKQALAEVIIEDNHHAPHTRCWL